MFGIYLLYKGFIFHRDKSEEYISLMVYTQVGSMYFLLVLAISSETLHPVGL